MSEAWESEERDDRGRFAGGGGGGGGGGGAFAETATGINITEQEALNSYAGSANFSDFNAPLRAGSELYPTQQAQISALDSAIAKQGLTAEDATVYRGVPTTGFTATEGTPNFSQMQPGERFLDPAFVSTTQSEAMAKGWSEGSEREGSGQLLEVHVPAGSQALDVSATKTASIERGLGTIPKFEPTKVDLQEQHVILPRASTFEVAAQLPDRTVVRLVR